MSSNQTFTPRFSTPAPAATGTPAAAAAAAAAAAHWTPQWNKSRANHVHLSSTTSSPLQFATAAAHSQFVQERLCFVSYQETLWPAISFMSFAEYAAYGASVGWTPAQRQQANISFLQQSMNSNSHKNKPTSYVQLLGFSSQDHKHFGVSEQFDFTDYLGIAVCALDDPSLFASLEIYQNFAQALDQAYAYLTCSTTPPQEGAINSFVQKANALWKEHAESQQQPVAAPAAPVETPAAQVTHNQEPALTPMAPNPHHQQGGTPFVYETPAMNETIPRAAALIPNPTAASRRPPFLSPAAGFPQRRRTSSTTTPVMQPNALEGRFDTMQTPVTQNHATAGSTPAAASTTNHYHGNSSPTTITVDSRQDNDSVHPNDNEDTAQDPQEHENCLEIDQTAEFQDIVSDLLMTHGWTVDHVDGMLFYLRPGKTLQTGKPESDFYSKQELQQWLKDSYGWTGPKKSRGTSSSAKKQQQQRQPSPKKKLSKKKAAAPKKAAASSVKKGRKAATTTPLRTPARPRRVATTPASASEHRYEGYYNFSFLWNHVLKPRGWTYENAKRTNKNPESQFATWCWVMAGYTQDTGQVNQQLFYTEQALVDYCRAMEMEDHPDFAPMGYNDNDEEEDEQPSTKKNAKGAARRGRKQQASAGKRRGRPAAKAQ